MDRNKKNFGPFSKLKAIIRRKTKDDNAVLNNNSYPVQSRRDSKRYTSQPMLVLSNNPTQSLDIDADDVSDQSGSPDRSPPLEYPQHHSVGHARKLSTQSTVSNDGFPICDGLQPNINGTGTANSAILPTTSQESIPNSLKPQRRRLATIDTSRASDESIPNSLKAGGRRSATIDMSRVSDESIPNSLKPGGQRSATIDMLKASDESLPNSLKPGGQRSATIDMLKASDESVPNSLKPGGMVKPPLPKCSKVKATEKSSTPPSKLLPPIPISLASSSSDDTVGPNIQTATPTPKLYMSMDRPAVLMYSSTPSLPSSPSSVTSDGRNGIGTADNPQALSVSSHVPDVPRRERLNPKLTVNTTLDINNNVDPNSPNSPINTSRSQQPVFTPIQPRRSVSSAPRLSLPPANYRFSLNLIDGCSARMSPSVILRPPPLPLLNLPVLSSSISTTSGASSRRSRRAGLMSMPALPRQGSSRGVAGHEQFDDVAEGDDDDDDEEDGDGDDDDDSAPLEDEADTPQSGYSSTSETISSRSGTPSSYETARPEPSTHAEYFGDLTRPPKRGFSNSPFLPPVDMSHIDLSFLNSPPSDSKGKSRELTEDAGRTPIATVRTSKNGGTASNLSTPTAFSGMGLFIPEETATDMWAQSVVTKDNQASSPTQTPRPGDHLNFSLPVPIPPSPRPVLPTRATENRLSVTMNTITQFPGAYKRASRSLIDVHALEKKEKVEQMVREEEENAEEERKKRVKAMRMSMRVGANSPFAQQSSGDDDGNNELKTSLCSPIPRQISLPPHSVDVTSAASSAAIKHKQPNNRISMAPAYDTIIPLRRRLSMPTFNSMTTPPPPYPDLFIGQAYGVKLTQIQPRDDEGQEKLPAYSNSIYLKAIMPRKLEFSEPGVQAKDRKWKRVLCVLEGTSFKVYKPPGISVIGKWWESKVGTGDMSLPATTTNSFNSGREGGGEANGIEENKGVVTWPAPSQYNNATPLNQRQGSHPTTSSSSYPSSATTNSGGLFTATVPATRSALSLAVHLLKPSSRSHGRTISDVGQPSNTPSVPQSPRSSLNIPRNGRSTPTPTIASTTAGASVSSSRSLSPMFASSSSLLTTPATSNLSHYSRDSTSSMVSGGGGGSSAASRMVTVASLSSTSKGKKKAEDFDPEPLENSLIKAYTMQRAECGLGTDYLKRKHVIRVRLEGEQFLLQAQDVESVIEWIEGLQAATNVAMDLDERPMPRGPLFPRRRRRRRVIDSTIVTNTPLNASQLAHPLGFVSSA